MHLQIITPTGLAHDGEVERCQFASATGLMEILPGHAPLMAELRKGAIRTEAEELPCGDGVVRVLNDEITVVCE